MKLALSRRELILAERQRIRGEHDGLIDPVPKGSPLQTAQLIGSLVIRFVMFAEQGCSWHEFPDKDLLERILENCRDRQLAEEHIVQLLFHHSKILDNVGTPEKNLKRMVKDAFPKVEIEDAKWEIV